MRYIKRKTNVRRHDRECKHKVADVRMHERNLKPRRILGVIPLKSLTYPQAKAIFPAIEPYGDIDEDKVINKRDCRPFDVERQDDDEIEIEQRGWPEDERQESWKRVIEREKNLQKFREDEDEEMTEQEMRDEIDANIREQEKREEGEKLARQLRFERELRAELEAAKERLEVNQEEVDENISNILARQRQKERGLW